VSQSAMQELRGHQFPVLESGFVRVVDWMGDDAAIVQAARVSYGEGTKQVQEDRGLIRYLLRHRHTTPFEMCELKLHIRVPMDTWRQWIRHRTANVNEYSTRYSLAIDAAATTNPDQWRVQLESNRQGSSGLFDITTGTLLSKKEAELQSLCRSVYEERIALGVAREQARKDLPLCTYTEAYWKIDLHNLLHFLALRMDHHAQKEIRDYATVIGEKIVSQWVPLTWQAFLDYRLNVLTLSSSDISYLKIFHTAGSDAMVEKMRQEGWFRDVSGKWMANREANELAIKMEMLGLQAPWLEN